MKRKRILRTGYHRNAAEAVALYAAESPGEPPYTEHSKLERNRMREIMDYLEYNYMNKIQMKDIAEEIHLCERMQPVIQEIHERIPVYISAGIPGGTEP